MAQIVSTHIPGNQSPSDSYNLDQPSRTQILVIGGGPGGSFSAASLAREGFEVTLFEADQFPRYHIGESLLPSVRPFLQFIGAEQKVIDHGFWPKPGGAIKFNQHKREGYTDFIARGPEFGSWNVSRSEFDHLMLKHAASCGVKVFENTKVNTIEFEKHGDPQSRPVAATYKNSEGEQGRITFDYVVDASGRNGVISTKYLKNRRHNETLKNIAIWGYWENCGLYKPGTDREGAIWIEALTDETGWVWFIPLAKNLVSVGVVMNHAQSIQKRNALREESGNPDSSLQDFYLSQVKLAPGLFKDLIPNARMVAKEGGALVRQASDYSYSADGYAGPGYRLVGDAACFIDPFFSSGVHLAFTGALSAAGTIASSIRGTASEEECAKWHNDKVSVSYTRFLLVVLGSYKQMRSQSDNVLSDVSEDNFDRAFDLLRPVIQGTADVNKKVTEDEVQQTMDFVKNVFAPTDPELEAAVQQRVDPKFFEGGETNILLPSQVESMFDDEDVKHVLHVINARKPVHKMFDTQRDFGSEPINGYTIRLVRGELASRGTAKKGDETFFQFFELMIAVINHHHSRAQVNRPIGLTQIRKEPPNSSSSRFSRLVSRSSMPHTSAALINLLPLETLGEIFSQVSDRGIQLVRRDAHPWTLIPVCRLWRDVVVSTPPLWAYVTIQLDPVRVSRVDTRGQSLIAAWKLCLQRSRNYPLTMIIDAASSDSFTFLQHLLLPLISHAGQWENMSFGFPLVYLLPFIRKPHLRFPRLRKLMLRGSAHSEPSFGIEADDQPPPSHLFQRAPWLSQVRLEEFPYSPSLLQLPWVRITNLTIRWCLGDSWDLLGILQNTPHLSSLTFTQFLSSESTPPETLQPQLLVLQQLKKINWVTIDAEQLALFDHVAAPQLTELDLSVGRSERHFQIMERFMRRSGCSVKKFRVDSIFDEKCLRILPDVEEIEFSSIPADINLIHALTFDESHPAGWVCTKLKKLVFRNVPMEVDFHSAFVNMVQSRLRGAAGLSHFSKLESLCIIVHTERTGESFTMPTAYALLSEMLPPEHVGLVEYEEQGFEDRFRV
ncbi:hypothetical protein NP233_g1073 [Leucocoprinus birnbaumii]|uniref:Uncharacterized protein n=1 Tax=Leucocoprinus birnbaumii TaxID=56174 RepID=A0AAD5YZW3_9AGAR|nr:hypothetical protein NP233_g1073 [Leucocoprinus birnbaumii]